MALNKEYQSQQEAIATYSYQDIAEGTGITIYYGFSLQIDNSAANDKYVLNQNAIISSKLQTTSGAAVDCDFDVTFNLPKTVGGTFYFHIPIHGPDTAGHTVSPIITIYKYDGTNETTLVAATTFQAVAQNAYKDVAGKITIPQTHFKSGETFRFNVAFAGDAGAYLYHDPLGNQANFPLSGGQLKVFVPFKLDL